MKHFACIYWIALTSILSVGIIKADEVQESMLKNLDFIHTIFQFHYAPGEWKNKYCKWDLNQEIQNAKDKVLNNEKKTFKDYQLIVRDFFKSTRDYHVNVVFHSTESAILPFRVQGAKGKYYFNYIDRTKLSPSVFPINEGDELVFFDGRPTCQVIRELQEKEVGHTNENTDRAFAEIFLTRRLGSLGHEIPKGPVMISVKPSRSERIDSYQLMWNYTSENIQPPRMAARSIPQNLPLLSANQFFNKPMLSPLYEELIKIEPKEDEESKPLGAKKSLIPPLGKIWWQAGEDNPFYAYLFETPNKKLIGYLRIPSYLGDETMVCECAKIINFFQERSEALVIDQINNPGGFVFYLNALASLLTNQPLACPKHRMAISQKEVADALQLISILEKVQTDDEAKTLLGPTLKGTVVTYQVSRFLLEFCRFIVNEWNAGRTITEPCYLYGSDHINPSPYGHYDKPILMLINSLDISAADFCPAIFQDNQRAVLFGTKTAGAGGYVLQQEFPNQLGINYFRYTGSIAERRDSSPIENLGVAADIEYELTSEDLQFGYKGYIQAIQNALNKMLENSML